MIWLIIIFDGFYLISAKVSAFNLLVVAMLPSSMTKFVSLPKLGFSLLSPYDFSI